MKFKRPIYSKIFTPNMLRDPQEFLNGYTTTVIPFQKCFQKSMVLGTIKNPIFT